MRYIYLFILLNSLVKVYKILFVIYFCLIYVRFMFRFMFWGIRKSIIKGSYKVKIGMEEDNIFVRKYIYI